MIQDDEIHRIKFGKIQLNHHSLHGIKKEIRNTNISNEETLIKILNRLCRQRIINHRNYERYIGYIKEKEERHKKE